MRSPLFELEGSKIETDASSRHSHRSRAVNLSDVLEMRYLFAEIAGERASIDASDLRTLLEVFCTASEEADIEAGM